jgi:hypothetical protein
MEQQLFDELAASPSCLQRLAQLAVDSSQAPSTQRMALALLTGRILSISPGAVAAAVAPHAAALVQRLPSPSPSTQMVRVELPGTERLVRLVALLADESAELAASMVAAAALPRLVALVAFTSPQLQPLRRVAVAALERLVLRLSSAAATLATVDGIAEVLVQLLASHQPPASCQLAWDKAEGFAGSEATALLGQLIKADAALARRAIAAGALPELTRVVRWTAQRLEWLARQGLWDAHTETFCGMACGGFPLLLQNGGPAVITPALQAELPQLLQLVLQHARSQDALLAASRLLAILRGAGGDSTRALNQGAAELLRQLQPGGQPDRAAAIAALLSELTSGAQQQQAGGSGAAAAPPVGPSNSSRAAAQAGGQPEAVPAECAACSALPPAGRKFQVCAGCRAVRYCSPACQKAGWQSGHKAACRAKSGGAKG